MQKITKICLVLSLLIGLSNTTFAQTNTKDMTVKTHEAAQQAQIFPMGNPLPEQYSKYFSGKAWLHMLVPPNTQWNCPIGNVTFEPRSRNNWHSHAGGQILIITHGKGWYQEKGKAAQALKAGDVVTIAPNVVYWHGARKDSYFTHLSVETNVNAGGPSWFEPVSDAEYDSLP